MHKQPNPSESAVNESNAKSITTAKNHVTDIASGVSREFSNFIADIEDLLKETAAMTGDDLARGNALLNARVRSAKEAFGGISDSMSEQMRKGSALTNEYVHEQPWKVIGGAALMAFALGLVFSRR